MSASFARGCLHSVTESIVEHCRIDFFDVEDDRAQGIAFDHVSRNVLEESFREFGTSRRRESSDESNATSACINQELSDVVIVKRQHPSGSANLLEPSSNHSHP